MKRYLTIFVTLFIFIIRVNAETYKTGDLIKYKDIKFYVVSDNGDYLTLLKATPLNKDEISKYSNNTITGHDNYYNYGYVPFCVKGDMKGVCSFDNSIPKQILNAWSKDNLNDDDLKDVDITFSDKKDDIKSCSDYDDEFLRDNQPVLIDNSTMVSKKYKVRLLTLDEATKYLGYTKNGNNEYISSNKTPRWVTSYSYAFMDYIHKIECYLSSSTGGNGGRYGGDSDGYYYNSYDYGSRHVYGSILRPVINLSKNASIIKLYIQGNKKKITDTEFKIGDIVEYNGKEFYVIKDASKKDDKLTIVSKLPLSYEEVKGIESVNYNTLNQGTIGLEDNKEYYPGYVRYYYHPSICYEPWNGHSNGCDNNYENSLIKPIVDEWADKFFEDKLTIDEMGYKARLLTIDELKNNLGYVGPGPTGGGTEAEYYKDSEDTPFILTHCFTMSSVLDTKQYVYSLGSSGTVYATYVYNNEGICPVVTIKKQVATNSDSNNNSSINEDNTVSVPDTLLKNPVFIVAVGIVFIVIATVIVSKILKRKK